MAISSMTHLKKHVLEMEAKEKLLHKDAVAVKGFIKRLENLDAGFKGYHCNVISRCVLIVLPVEVAIDMLINNRHAHLVEEDEEVLLEEQAKLDDHEDKVTDLMNPVLKLGGGEENVATPSVAGSSMPLKKRLGSLDSEL